MGATGRNERWQAPWTWATPLFLDMDEGRTGRTGEFGGFFHCSDGRDLLGSASIGQGPLLHRKGVLKDECQSDQITEGNVGLSEAASCFGS